MSEGKKYAKTPLRSYKSQEYPRKRISINILHVHKRTPRTKFGKYCNEFQRSKNISSPLQHTPYAKQYSPYG